MAYNTRFSYVIPLGSGLKMEIARIQLTSGNTDTYVSSKLTRVYAVDAQPFGGAGSNNPAYITTHTYAIPVDTTGNGKSVTVRLDNNWYSAYNADDPLLKYAADLSLMLIGA